MFTASSAGKLRIITKLIKFQNDGMCGDQIFTRCIDERGGVYEFEFQLLKYHINIFIVIGFK